MIELTKYLFIVLACFAIGDFLGIVSKARLSSVFIAFTIFIVGFMTGLFPKDIIEQAGLTEIGKWSSVLVVFNMGTGINLVQLRQEWKIVIMSVVGMLVAFAAIMAISPLIGVESALVSIPIVNGGINATQIMTDGAMAKGLTEAAALGAFIFAVQKFVGTIPSSYFARKEASALVADFREKQAQGINLLHEFDAATNGSGKEAKEPFYKRHMKFYTSYICLGIAGLVSYLSYFIAGKTPFLNYAIWALFFGILLNGLGLVPPRILQHGRAIGILMMATFAKIIPSLADVGWHNLASLGFQTAMVFIAVLLFTYVLIYKLPLWKIVGSKNLAMGCAMSQLLGFPATQLIVDEVALAMSETDDERDYVASKLAPAFVVSGFVSVTSVSVIIAGILVNFL